MGQGYIRNDTSNNISDGKTINSSDLDGEFDAIVDAFSAGSGHTHDGTTAEGGPVSVLGPSQEYVGDGTSLSPKADDTYDLGSVGAEWRDLHLDGTANIDTASIEALTVTTSANFAGVTVVDGGNVSSIKINGGTIDGVTLGVSSPVTELQVDNLNFNGNTISSTDAAGNIVITPDTTGDLVLDGLNWPQTDGTNGQFIITNGLGQLAWGSTTSVDFTSISSHTQPDTDNLYDLGRVGAEWRDLFIDGTANIDSLVADTADINGGTIDGVTIGGTSAGAVTCTALTANDNVILGSDSTDTVTINADVSSNILPATDNAYDLGAVGSEWKDLFVDGVANIDSLVADTADINGGTIDGVTIGTNSAVTELVVDTMNFNGSTIQSSADLTLEALGDDLHLLSANVYIEEDLVHSGDTSNKFVFGTDTQDFRTGSASRLDISDSGVRLGAANARVTTILDEDTMSSNSATALVTQQSIKAYVDNLAVPMIQGTEQATTSGTVFNFTGIPAGTKEIDIIFDQVSLDGTDAIRVQLGDAGGYETSGYVSASKLINSITSTSGFVLRTEGATNNITGIMTLRLMDATTFKWISGSAYGSAATGGSGSGVKSLSAELTSLRINTSGSDNFDNGSVNILYR